MRILIAGANGAISRLLGDVLRVGDWLELRGPIGGMPEGWAAGGSRR
jgi:hypothetical protein